MEVNIKKLSENAVIPTRGSAFAAGFDLYACMDAPVCIKPQQTAKIPTGIAMEIPQGYGGFVYARSGLASKKGLAPANKVGVVDADYRGEILVFLHNHSMQEACVEPGERIAQLVIAPVLQVEFQEVENLQSTQRGTGGFGSTGRK